MNAKPAASKPSYAPVAAAKSAMTAAHKAALAGVGQPGNDARWEAYRTAVDVWCAADKAYWEAAR